MNTADNIFNIPVLTREYTITCPNDEMNVNKGKCPDYALEWSNEQNKLHWPYNHNYLKGLSTPTNSSGLSSPCGNSSGFSSPCGNSSNVTNSLDTFLLLQEDNNKKEITDKEETPNNKNTYCKLFRKVASKIFENKKETILFCSLEVLVCNIDDNISELNLSKSGKQLWAVITKFKPYIVVHNKYYTTELISWCKFNLDTDNVTVYSVIKEDELVNEELLSYLLIDNNYSDEYKNQIFIQSTNVNETLQKILQHI